MEQTEQSLKQQGSEAAHAESRAGKPVRVLLVGPSLGGFLGGQAVQLARLLECFEGEPSLEAAFLPVDSPLPAPLQWLKRVKYLRTVVNQLFYCATLLRRVRSFDVIHIFSASYFSFVLAPTPALLVAKLYGKKSVLNYRSGQAEEHLRRWRRTAIPTIRLADVIAVPSGYLVDVFARFGLRARQIFNIVELERYSFRERRPLRPVFLSNRNFEPLYNVACVLRAFAVIQRSFPEARLTLAGDGSQRAELESLARELELRNTQFLGRVPQKRMHELYDAADIFLNASNIDNMPGSIIEAFASGLPVVTTEAGGIPYIVTHGETGLLVPCGNHEALAANALGLLEDEALASKIAEAARRECRKYNWNAVRDEWLRLYHGLARGEAEAASTLTGEVQHPFASEP
ncbi:MAG TPA: glycosyltransferase family 4 protein [Pyrinomonadaceae bacterium]|jgi:glycosyltransferase involved in cell wall biosynthesis